MEEEKEMIGIHVDGIQMRGFKNQEELDNFLKRYTIDPCKIRKFTYQKNEAENLWPDPAFDGTGLA